MNNEPYSNMYLLKHLPPWLKNKYFISFSAFIVIMFFLDKNDLFTQYGRHRELRELKQSREFYTNEINAERIELQQLKQNPSTLEKYAREKYLMKKDGEELFIVPENHADHKN
jgi:cell division protein FtsB